jgi:hypothetical protein
MAIGRECNILARNPDCGMFRVYGAGHPPHSRGSLRSAAYANYMNAAGLRREFDMEAYVSQVENLTPRS